MEKPLSLAAKLLLFGAGGLAFVAGPILFLFPTQTETYFAWTIKHPLTPIFMGANYLGGLGALWTLYINRWSVARVQMPGIFVFAVTQLFATLLHIPIFNWHHPIAWAWLFVYVTSPVATLWVYLAMERGYKAPVSNGPASSPGFGTVMRIFAAISALFGIGLILWPFFPAPQGLVGAVPWWAWTLTPLTAHVAGGWYLAAATLQFTLSRQRAMDTVGPSIVGLMLVTGTQILGAIIHMGAFNGPPLFIALYLINATAVFLFALYTFLRSRSAFRMAQPQASP